MPWFKIDDKAHSHPKWLKAGNAALGLFVRAGSYSAQHLTEGIVPGVIAQLYGTGPQAAKLVKVGLWHGSPHDCPRCPQPQPGDYVIHDFFEAGRNSTRQAVEEARKRGAERQSRKRERDNAPRIEEESASNRPRFDDEKSANRVRFEPHFEDSVAGQEGLSQRDALDSVTALQATPSTSVPPTEVQLASSDGAAMLPMIGHRPRIPANCQPLVDALTADRMAVGWDLTAKDWFLVEALIQRCGVPMLVDHARGQWLRAKSRPQNGTYFVPGWRTLPDVPQAATGPATPSQTGPLTRNQLGRSLLDEAAARLAAGGTQ